MPRRQRSGGLDLAGRPRGGTAPRAHLRSPPVPAAGRAHAESTPRRVRAATLPRMSAGPARESKPRRSRAGGVAREIRAVDPVSWDPPAIIVALQDWVRVVGGPPR